MRTGININNQVVHDTDGNILDYQFDHFPEIKEEIEVDGKIYLVQEINRELGKPDMIRVENKERYISRIIVTPIP